MTHLQSAIQALVAQVESLQGDDKIDAINAQAVMAQVRALLKQAGMV